MKSKNLKYYLILLFVSIITLVMTALFASIFFATKDVIEEKIGMSAQNIAVATAQTIMKNVDEYIDFLENRDIDSNYYKKIQYFLSNVKDESNVQSIYTLLKTNNNEFVYILNAEPIGSEKYFAPGTEETEIAANDYLKVYETKSSMYFKTAYYEKWGKIISAYSPILDKKGEIIGLVGTNIDALELFSNFNQLFIVAIIIYVFLLIIIIFLLVKFLPLLLKPMMTDKLTGAYDKRFFEEQLIDKLKNYAKNNKSLSLLMIDLDHFKSINDTYGHPFGDVVLSKVSAIIDNLLRKSDYFIRYGGEEFMVVLPNTEIKDAKIIATRIRKAIEKEKIFNEENNININITISIGIAHADDNTDINELINNADKALYTAKIKRNDIAIFK